VRPRILPWASASVAAALTAPPALRQGVNPARSVGPARIGIGSKPQGVPATSNDHHAQAHSWAMEGVSAAEKDRPHCDSEIDKAKAAPAGAAAPAPVAETADTGTALDVVDLPDHPERLYPTKGSCREGPPC
jgi:hypothetical protein